MTWDFVVDSIPAPVHPVVGLSWIIDVAFRPVEGCCIHVVAVCVDDLLQGLLKHICRADRPQLFKCIDAWLT